MRRSNKSPSRKFSADSQRLAVLAQSLVQSGSRLEMRNWEDRLDSALQKLLSSNQQQAIDSALDHLFHTDLAAYDGLLDAVEAISASCSLEHEGQRYDALLLAIPILAWTRFAIPAGPVPDSLLQTIKAHLHGHILAAHTRAVIAPMLFAIDQLPRSYCDTYQLTHRMAEAALSGKPLQLPAEMPETAPFLADTRFLLLAVTAPAGQPLLRWQEESAGINVQASSLAALTQWQVQAGPNLQTLFPGCGIELLLPEAYYVACRDADKKIRPISIRAAVHYLTHALAVEASQLAAVVAGFGDENNGLRIDEYRISFSVADNPEVFYGVVWPLYDEESGEDELHNLSLRRPAVAAPMLPLQQIVSLLREAGVTRIMQPDQLFAPEFCEDCGAPLFCDPIEELVHAEMPEDTPQHSGHLH
jgi:hypothetical protein